MRPTADALLQAQLDFFLQDFQGDSLRRHLTTEAEAYCDLLEKISVRQLLGETMVIAWIERNILAYEPTDAFRQQAVMLVEMGLNNPGHLQQPMRQLINRQLYDLLVERLVERPGLRQEVIHVALSSPVYTRLLSDVVYHSIVDYLTTENPLARNVPGVSSLLKVGKGMIGRMGKLESTVELAIKAYIERNIRSTAAFSEKLVERVLSDDNIRRFADDLWPRLESYQLGQATRHLEIQGLSYLAVLYWNQIRKTDYMKQQINYLVTAWYQHAGDRPAMEVLEDLGISRNQVVREVVALGEPLVSAWVRTGHIEQRLREHLQRFYQAPATLALFAAGADPA